jgi:hypothetical protein
MRRAGWSVTGMVLAGAAVVAASCAQPVAKAAVDPAVHPAAATAPASSAPTLAGNERLARREATRLIGLADVPPGARRVQHAPHGLAGPPETSTASTMLDRHALWTVRLPFTSALAYVQAHPPAGLADDGNSFDGHGPGLLVSGFVYDSPVQPWGSGRFEIEVSRLGPDSTGIRVDAVITWLDPRPERDTVTGPRLRITVGATCPISDERTEGVRSPGRFLSTQMVPAAKPTVARICWYSGFDPAPGFRLVRQQVRTAAGADAIATAAAAIPLTHDDGEAISCPADVGQAIAIALSYPGRPDVDLWYRTTGCPSLANGHITALAFNAAAGLTDLGR